MQRLLCPAALLALCAAAAPATYTNPVLGGDVPDPGVVWAAELGLFVASTTGCDASGACFALHTSPDLASWTPAGALFPTLATFPAWASRADLTAWAPEIHRLASGEYLAVFVSKDAAGALVVGAARSTGGALGPYAATAAPLVTAPPGACYGVIDPTVVVSSSDAAAPPTLVFKTDGNSCGQRTDIVAVQLTPDGLNVSAGAPWRTLLTNSEPWEGPLVEAPWLIHNASSGYYYLFFSGSVYDQASYSIGVARGRALDAPFEKAPFNPMLRTRPGAAAAGLNYGPGHCAVVGLPPGAAQPQRWAIVYAAEQAPAGPHRNLMLDALVWEDGWPVVSGGYPSSTAQPIPR